MSIETRDGTPAAHGSGSEGDPAQGLGLPAEGLVPRPRALSGATYQVETPIGTVFVTVNVRAGSGGDEPFEVFVQVGKAGTDLAALAETIGRLCSVCLQLPGPVPARERVAIIVSQLGGVAGVRPSGARRARSLPAALARVLADATTVPVPATQPSPPASPNGSRDLCPSCGQAALILQEDGRRCDCGFDDS